MTEQQKRMRPKFRNLRELEAKGVIPFTIWDFSQKGELVRKGREEKAMAWLKAHPDDSDLEEQT